MTSLKIGDFGANLSDSVTTPNFIMIELETTKLEEGGTIIPPYYSVFKIYPILNRVKIVAIVTKRNFETEPSDSLVE